MKHFLLSVLMLALCLFGTISTAMSQNAVTLVRGAGVRSLTATATSLPAGAYDTVRTTLYKGYTDLTYTTSVSSVAWLNDSVFMMPSSALTLTAAATDHRLDTLGLPSFLTLAITDDASYPWEAISGAARAAKGPGLMSTNQGVNSSNSESTITFTSSSAFFLNFDWLVSSESRYDKLTIYLDGATIVDSKSGYNVSGHYTSASLAAGSHTLRVLYSKDSSQDNNDDCAYVYNFRASMDMSSVITKSSCVTTTFAGDSYPWVLTDATQFPDYAPGLMSDNYQLSYASSTDTITITTTKDARLVMHATVSSESGYDKLYVTLDGNQLAEMSGDASRLFRENIATGTHTLILQYSKDGSYNYGSDRAFVYGMSISALDELPSYGVTATSTGPAPTTTDKTSYYEGDTVTLTTTMQFGYRFDSYQAMPTVTWVNGNQFIMPAQDVAIIAQYKREYAITILPGEHITATADVTTAIEGERVYLSFSPEDGYEYQSCQTTPTLEWTSSNCFTMPAQDVTITPCVNMTQYTITLVSCDGMTISCTEATAHPSQHVQLTAVYDSTRFDYFCYDAAEAVVSRDGRFSMPNNNITIYARAVARRSLVDMISLEEGMTASMGAVTQYPWIPVTEDVDMASCMPGLMSGNWCHHSTNSIDTIYIETNRVSELSLYCSVSSELNCDKLTIYANGEAIVKDAAGESNSIHRTKLLPQGANQLVLYYHKDGSSNVRKDRAFVYNITVSTPSELPYHRIAITEVEDYSVVVPDSAQMGDTIVLSPTLANNARVVRYDNIGYVRWINDSSFVMLEQNVTVTPVLLYPSGVVINASEHAHITSSPALVYKGDTVRLSVRMDEDYQLTGTSLSPSQPKLNDTTFIINVDTVTVSNTEWYNPAREKMLFLPEGVTAKWSDQGNYPWATASQHASYMPGLISTNWCVPSSSSETSIELTLDKPYIFSFCYRVSSESNSDKMTVSLDGKSIVNAISGSRIGRDTVIIAGGKHTLKLLYSKDNSVNTGDDRAYVYNCAWKEGKTVALTLVDDRGVHLSHTNGTLIAGQTVSLDVTCERGSLLDSIASSLAGIEWINATTFVMPDTDLVLTAVRKDQVSATFVYPEDSTYTISYKVNGLPIASGDVVYLKDTITVYAETTPGYVFIINGMEQYLSSMAITESHVSADTIYESAIPTVAGAPRVLAVDYAADGSATITWLGATDNYGYGIVSGSADDAAALRGITRTTSRSCTLEGLVAGKTYTFFVALYEEDELASAWTTYPLYIPTDEADDCLLTVEMYSPMKYGWFGGALRITDGDVDSLLTMEKGDTLIYHYRPQTDDIVIRYVAGSLNFYIGWKVTNAYGQELAAYYAASEGLASQTVLFSGDPCNVTEGEILHTDADQRGMQASLQVISSTGYADYALLPLTDIATRPDDASVMRTTDNATALTDTLNPGTPYIVYYRAHEDGKSGAWYSSAFWTEGSAVLGDIIDITLPYSTTGMLMDAANMVEDGKMVIRYRFTLTDTMSVMCNHTMSQFEHVLRDTLGNVIQRGSTSSGFSVSELPAGTYLFDVAGNENAPYGFFMLAMKDVGGYSTAVPVDSITLPYEALDVEPTFIINDVMGPGYGYGLKLYEMEVDQDSVFLSCAVNVGSVVFQGVLSDSEGTQLATFEPMESTVLRVDSGSYFITIMMMSGHTFDISLSLSDTLVPTVNPLRFDTIAVGEHVLMGSKNGLGMYYLPIDSGVQYDVRAISYTNLRQAEYYIYGDAALTHEITDGQFLNSYAYNGGFSNDTLDGVYIAVNNYLGEDLELVVLGAPTNYGQMEVTGDTLLIGETRELEMDVFAPFDYHTWPGCYKALTVHLDSGVLYRAYADVIGHNSYAVGTVITDPSATADSTAIKMFCTGSDADDAMTKNSVTRFDVDSTGYYTFANCVYFGSTGIMARDTVSLHLRIDEVVPFDSLVAATEVALLPLSETADFDGAYFWSESYEWHKPNSFLSSAGIHYAASHYVTIYGGDTLFARAYGDGVMTIDMIVNGAIDTSATAANAAASVDLMYVNRLAVPQVVMVVVSQHNDVVRAEGKSYHLELSTSSSIVSGEVVATPKASEELIYLPAYYASPKTAARDLLADLDLQWVDPLGHVIMTIDNEPTWWNIDLEAGVARYETFLSERPEGYNLADTVFTVQLISQSTVYAHASASQIELDVEYTEAAALAALQQLVLTAQKADGSVVMTFDNVADGWSVDLTNGVAQYTLYSTDLPLQFTFEDREEVISVTLIDATDLESISADSNELRAEKFYHNGHIYIRFNGMIFDSTGRRVE